MDGDKVNDPLPDVSLMQKFAHAVAVHAMDCMYWQYCLLLRWVPQWLSHKIEKKLKADLIASVQTAVSDVAYFHRVSIRRDSYEGSLPRPSRN